MRGLKAKRLRKLSAAALPLSKDEGGYMRHSVTGVIAINSRQHRLYQLLKRVTRGKRVMIRRVPGQRSRIVLRSKSGSEVL